MKYKKKPVVIEAWQVQSDMGDCPKWFTDELGKSIKGSGGIPVYFIDILEGQMKAQYGDYIIKGVKGEIYPCKPDIFEATYEKVEEETEDKNQINIEWEKTNEDRSKS